MRFAEIVQDRMFVVAMSRPSLGFSCSVLELQLGMEWADGCRALILAGALTSWLVAWRARLIVSYVDAPSPGMHFEGFLYVVIQNTF